MATTDAQAYLYDFSAMCLSV